MLKGLQDWKRTRLFPVGGETITRLTDRISQTRHHLEQFDVLAVLSGTNDIAQGATVDQLKRRYRQLRQTVSMLLPGSVLIIISLLPRPCDYDPKIKVINKWLARWCPRHHTLFIKAFRPFKHGHEGIHEDLYGSKRLHLNNHPGKSILGGLLRSQLGDKNIRAMLGRL